MKKIKGTRRVQASMLALTLAAAITLTGCEYTGDIFHDIGSISSGLTSSKEFETVVPRSIDPIQFEEITVIEEPKKMFESPTERKEQIAPLSVLEDINVYLEYQIENGNVFYSVEFLKPVVTEDYIAYYKALDGRLVTVDILNTDKVNPKAYTSYLKTSVIKIGPAANEVYNPNYSNTVTDGIDFDNNTITRKSYVYMELAAISKHSDTVSEIVDGLRGEKELTK